MATYVITLGDTTLTIGDAWSERDAIEAFYDKIGKDWASVDDFEVDSIRPATVREALVEAYGEDWQIHHGTYEVVNTYHTDGKDVLTVNCTGANDVHGYDDAVSVSNYRVLSDRWSALEGLSRGPWSNIDVIALEVDSEAPSDLVDVLESLESYPVLDEDEWSTVEQEMIQEHWDSYGKSDTLDAVAKAIGQDSSLDLTAAAEDIVDTLVWEGVIDYGYGGGYPSFIDASAVDFGTEAIAEFFAQNYGTVVTLKPANGWREDITLDLTKANLVYLPVA